MLLIITDQQMKAFSELETEKFRKKVIAILEKRFPDKILHQKKSRVIAFVDDMIKFCGNYSITEEEDVEKMILAKVKYEYNIPLDDQLKQLLMKNSKSKNRISIFLDRLRYG